ncbi:unnamed protein product [Chilo suppressalis]|uniref:Uncharacterized protein n=2 Tax=Chilo suppressalis TaxID=168631 RepID=A0ABN8B1A2_CHISP|nr:unnamed protein product [Chilo suppressalis]
MKMQTLAIFVVTLCAVAFTYVNSTTTTEKVDKDNARDLMTSGSEQDIIKTPEETDTNPDLMAIMGECNETFRIETSYLESLNESGSFPDESDKTPKCYIRCVLMKTGVTTEDGKFIPDVTSQVFASQNIKEQMDGIQNMATACAVDRNESCKCDRSYMFMKCLMESEIKSFMKIM